MSGITWLKDAFPVLAPMYAIKKDSRSQKAFRSEEQWSPPGMEKYDIINGPQASVCLGCFASSWRYKPVINLDCLWSHIKQPRRGLIHSHQHYRSHAPRSPQRIILSYRSLDLSETLPDTTTFIILITEISSKQSILEPSYSAVPGVLKFPRGNEGRLRM